MRRFSILACALTAAWILPSAMQALAGEEACTVYMYIDDQGETQRTRNIQKVPLDKRNSVIKYVKCGKLDDGEGSSYTRVGPTGDTEEGGASSVVVVGDEKESKTWKWLKERLSGHRGYMFLAFLVLCLAGEVGLLIAAFRMSVIMGIAILLLPILVFVFTFANWHYSKIAFFAWLVGVSGMIMVLVL